MYSTSYFTIRCRGEGDFPHDKAEDIAATGSRFRGEVINEMIHLEHKIEELIRRYFCSDPKRHDLFSWKVLRPLRFKDKTDILFAILKDECDRTESTIKGHVTELAELRNKLAHGDAAYDVSTGRLHFVFRGGEYTVGDELKNEIDSKVKAVDDFLNTLLADPHFR